jgi:hypothetical protein
MRMASAFLAYGLVFSIGLTAGAQGQQRDVFDRVAHGYAVSEGGVRIHYATLGT